MDFIALRVVLMAYLFYKMPFYFKPQGSLHAFFIATLIYSHDALIIVGKIIA